MRRTASVGASFASPLDDLRASLLSWANVSRAWSLGTSPASLPSVLRIWTLKELPVSENAPLVPISLMDFTSRLRTTGRNCGLFGQRLIVLRLFSFSVRRKDDCLLELFHGLPDPKKRLAGRHRQRDPRLFICRDMADASYGAERKLDVTEGSYQVINLASGREQNVLQWQSR